MRIAQIGNFGPSASTENELYRALTHSGEHQVDKYQENEPTAWALIHGGIMSSDLVLWTRTGWNPADMGWTKEDFHARQREMMATAKRRGIPVIGYHLDRFIGLPRQQEIPYEPFFHVDLLITADGGHQAEWEAFGVNHRWLPPAVSEFECVGGIYDGYYASSVAFVGSWNGYHPEWRHRFDLVTHLQRRSDIKFWPELGRQAVRGVDLRNLYASTKVNVGDSCLVGGATHYWSDRIPETLGRGGLLIHPSVDGLDEHFTPGEHLLCWQMGNWTQLDSLIEQVLGDEDLRVRIATAGKAHVLEHHTYTRRMEQMIAMAREL